MVTTGSRRAPGPDILALARQVAAIVRHTTRSPSYRVFLFGSHVSGDAGPRSDIDIGIEGPAAVDPRAMQEIREGCEKLSTLRTIDLVDFTLVGPAFRRSTEMWPIEPELP